MWFGWLLWQCAPAVTAQMGWPVKHWAVPATEAEAHYGPVIVTHAFFALLVMSNTSCIAAAIELFHAGAPARALEAIGHLLEGADAQVDALHLAAACARALDDPRRAERYARHAVVIAPDNAASWNNLGILLQQQGNRVQALQAYGRALALNPAYADAHYNLALLHQQSGALEAALASHRQALALAPTHAGASANLGVVLEALGRFDEAQQQLGNAVAIDPRDAAVLQRRADILQRLGRRADALECYRAALALTPHNPELHNNLAVLHAGAGRPDLAEAAYRRALDLRPDYADAWHNLGLLYSQRRRYDQAEAALTTYIGLRPRDPEGLNSIGNIYQYQGDDERAEAAYRTALALRPGYAKTLNNLGALLQRKGCGADAEAAYRAAVDADPAYPEARWNLGFLLLAQGRLDEGWPWMEARYDARLARPIATPPRLPFPAWRGDSLAGRSIVVWPEQGFGDLIQFVRYLPLLKAAGAARVTLVCPEPLLPLLRGVAGADVVLGTGAASQLAAHDCWVLMLSLPMHFHTTLATIPATLPYLAPDPARVRHWHARLGQAAPKALRVGLVWRGFSGHVNDAQRSLPGLAALAPLLAVDGIDFVSLQRGMDQGEADPDAAQFGLPDVGAAIADFGDTAAVVAQLDLVICVDTAVAHVAGALGIPCWVLLPAVHPDWRWMQGRSDSPWYPDVIKLYRQHSPGQWQQLVAEMAENLRAWAAVHAA